MRKLTEFLPERHKVLGAILCLHKLDILLSPSQPSTGKMTEGRNLPGSPHLYSQLKASLGFKTPCFKHEDKKFQKFPSQDFSVFQLCMLTAIYRWPVIRY